MALTILAFAQARDRLGFSSREVECHPDDTPRTVLFRIAPEAGLEHLAVALDCEFCSWDTLIGSAKELALIPPVSGG